MTTQDALTTLQTELMHAERIRAYRVRTGTVIDLDPLPAVLDPLLCSSEVVLRDKGRGRVWLTVRAGVVVGALGSDPRRFVGLSLERARHVARYGGSR